MASKLKIDSSLDPTTVVPMPITAWIPVKRPLRMPEWPEDFEICCGELRKNMSKLLPHLDCRCDGFAVWTLDEKEVPSSVLSLNKCPYSLPDYLQFLKIDCTFKMRAGDIVHSGGRRATLGDLISIGASILAEIVHDIFLFASIAYPARFHTRTGQVFVGPNAFNTVDPMPGFSLDNLYSEEQLWPTVECRRLTKVINWEKKIGLFQKDLATTPLQRALACYSRLQHIPFNDAYSMLFFAMQGLEAFYCRGVGDLRRQLSEKCKLFLGKWPTSKNIIGELYSIRSSFVHGSYPIQRANSRHGLNDTQQKHDDAVTDAASLATRLLIASLHKCIDRGITSVEFDWHICTNSSNTAEDHR